jgi:competence protein ComEA
MLNNFLNSYFGFTKQQRNGLFVLICISLVLLLIRLVYPSFIKSDPIVLLNLPLAERKLDSSYQAGHFNKKSNTLSEEKTTTLFVFDPNTVRLDQLLALGFSEKTARIFLKFRNKGFVFKEKKDLQKVFGVSALLYARLEPYIYIEKITESKKQTAEAIQKQAQPVIQKQSQKQVELNSADSLSLVALNGIGAVYTKRILKYRALLGGFVSVTQLKEVYGFSEEMYQQVSLQVYVDAGKIQKLNLNKDDFKRINKHPYLSYELTKTIFDWRKKTSINSTNLKDLLHDDSLYQKLLPYLAFD